MGDHDTTEGDAVEGDAGDAGDDDADAPEVWVPERLELDQPEHDTLLGTPLRGLLNLRSIQGLAILTAALALLLWPDRTDQVIAVLAGVATAAFMVVLLVELVRDRSRRTFPRVSLLAVGSGVAAALLAHPDESLRSATRAAGVALVALVALDVVGLLRRREAASAWRVARDVGVVLVGILLLAYPDRTLTAATSLVAVLLAAVGLIELFSAPASAGEGVTFDLRATVTSWLQRRSASAEDRTVLQDKLFFEGPDSHVRYARFAALMAFASVIASIGVVVESTAVVIGAMLIAPLMVPLLGTTFALATGWPRRLRRCAGVAVSGVGIAIGLGAVVGVMVPQAIDVSSNSEIVSRISPTMIDLAIAVAAGAAGAFALSRSDVSDSLPGVAVAIALVPPLTVVGICWQQGAWQAGNGALLLFTTNAAAILVAGGVTFVLVGAVPLRRVSESQRRLATVTIGVLAAFVFVVLLLILNGSDLARSELARSGISETLEDWTEENPDYVVLEQRNLADGSVEIDLAGPDRPPGLRRLLADLREGLAENAELTVTWTPRHEVTVSGGS